MTPEIDPAEADLGFAVSKRRRAEENFPGAARILGHLEDGPPRKRVGLTVDGKLPVREGAKLFDGEDEIGVGTSGGFAPSVGAPVAMAIGRAAGRERVCQYVLISVVAVSLKK